MGDLTVALIPTSRSRRSPWIPDCAKDILLRDTVARRSPSRFWFSSSVDHRSYSAYSQRVVMRLMQCASFWRSRIASHLVCASKTTTPLRKPPRQTQVSWPFLRPIQATRPINGSMTIMCDPSRLLLVAYIHLGVHMSSY